MGATAAVGMQGFGAGFSAMGSLGAGKAQQQLANYNAQVAEMQAQDAIVRGRETEARHRTDVKRMIGSQRAGFAASGVDVNDGSAVDVQADTAALGELDALTIRTNAAREAWGYKIQAQDYAARGQIARAESTSKAVGTILSTAGSALYSKYGFSSTTKKDSANVK